MSGFRVAQASSLRVGLCRLEACATLKIASWNINSLRKREERLLLWLRETSPDVVCLQETKCTDDLFPAETLRDAGYAAVFHGQKSYNGVAILAKDEPREVRMGFCDEVGDEQARIIAASVGDVRVLSIYAPNGQAVGSEAYRYKMEWFRRLTNCLREMGDTLGRVLVCGDFNVAPNDEDVHDPALWHGAIMCSEDERAAFQRPRRTGAGRYVAINSSGAGDF